MQKLCKVTALVIFVGIIFGFFACQTPAGRTTGQVVDDASITTKVKAKLFKSPVTSGFAISVNTFKGEVTLTGAVDSDKAKNEAENIARSTAGVSKVHNLIKIK